MSDSPWDVHIEYMLRVFGRRDPDCAWCGETVYMSLQGSFSGGIWTTDALKEGPMTAADGPSTECPQSPDGEHSCFALDTEAWLAS